MFCPNVTEYLVFLKSSLHESRKWRVLRSGQDFSTCPTLPEACVFALVSIVTVPRMLTTRFVYYCRARIGIQTNGNKGFGPRNESFFFFLYFSHDTM
jgi:hypothetical protein